MLVLSRGLHESITIGDDTIVTVVAVRGDKIRLGIQAPKEKRIMRSDILAENELEKIRQAAGAVC